MKLLIILIIIKKVSLETHTSLFREVVWVQLLNQKLSEIDVIPFQPDQYGYMYILVKAGKPSMKIKTILEPLYCGHHLDQPKCPD